MILNGVYKANCQFWDTLWKTENVFCCCCLFTQNDWLELTSWIPKPRFQHGTAISQRGESCRGCVMYFTEIFWAFALNYFRKVRLQTASLKGKHSSSSNSAPSGTALPPESGSTQTKAVSISTGASMIVRVCHPVTWKRHKSLEQQPLTILAIPK